MKRLLALCLFALVIACTGCQHNSGPNNLPIVVDSAELNAIKALIADYRANPDHLTADKRNDLLERLLGVSDDHYIRLRNGLLRTRHTVSFMGEVSATTLSAVGALLADADTQTILSTASTLTQSTKTSIDKNFFNNTSTEAIVSKMDALRATVRTRIANNEVKSLANYGLAAALNDARGYDDSGTVQTALISIAADAAANKNDSEKQLNDLLLTR